jgi:hypothetical protein
VEWHLGELFPRVGFVVTNMSSSPEAVVHFYNRRGTCEQWIKEGKNALTWTRLSCTRFSSNQVRLALFVLAYNLGKVDAIENPPSGEGMREGTGLEFVNAVDDFDGRKQGVTIPGQRENTRP